MSQDAGQARATLPHDSREVHPRFHTVVLNDPVNLQSYVSFVFRTHFGYDRERSHRLMMLVHTEGRAIVSTDGREKAEAHVAAMHGYGLHAVVESAKE